MTYSMSRSPRRFLTVGATAAAVLPVWVWTKAVPLDTAPPPPATSSACGRRS